MKKNIRHILYTSMALGVTLTTAVMLEGSANADTTEPNQTQQTVQAAQPTTASANTATNDKQQSTNTDALDQAEAQKQAQYQQRYDTLYEEVRKANQAANGMPFVSTNQPGYFTEKPTKQFSPALAQKLYEANDARNAVITKDTNSLLNTKTDTFDHALSMISNFSYQNDTNSTFLPNKEYELPLRTDVKSVPQDDQFYIDWLDHEVKLLQGEPETYQVPAEYTNLIKRLNYIADNYGGDDALLDGTTEVSHLYGLPGFNEWDFNTNHMVHLLPYPGNSEYDVKFYTPYLTALINTWEEQRSHLQKEYAAKNGQAKTDQPETPQQTPAKNTNQQPEQKASATTDSSVVTRPQTVANSQKTVQTALPVKTAVSSEKSAQQTEPMTVKTVTTTPIAVSTNTSSLPQTGNDNKAMIASIGLGLSTLAMMFGFARKRQY
ncbi:LPXTG cell wall anchor domain-containing protein [Limosilactobacillus reuteri]|uniref:LPXTG cell wall anchor domain-containing protein n=1 Tax=Limosilactobacillus reuteri TaxID=1598 RepID=UPI001E351007|nr:LPXTG cell wall anchor domain-containing protein [Limosilactobacillus reuteri]MCC4331613.1 LPXTG cell wall anchor domain-containing protein [Limosilactobacillus reuteri]MCC4354879.1 LPXTG cell wall anchor domain-containing protein [Limosilactobacillus reuteri]MCC4502664.1 LPXTG cell wall anchor domain-containing protein [Limosilactobacillus reuteri]